MTRTPGLARAIGVGAAALLAACALRSDMAPAAPCGTGAAAGIRWWGPDDPADRSANAARCGTVGDPVVTPAPAAGFGPPVPGDSVAVVTWNVAVGGADLVSFLEREMGLTCAGPRSRPGPRFRHVILLLQEAHRHSDALPPMDDPRLAGSPAHHPTTSDADPDVVDAAALCGLAAAYVPSGRNGADRPGRSRLDKGNAILSSLPLAGVSAVETPFETERKVVVAADVPIPGGRRLRVVSVHLDVVTNFRRALGSGNQNRARQARGVIEALDSLELDGGAAPPTLVAGDFNTWSGFEAALRLFRAAFPESPRWGGQGTRGPFPTDHVFFREGEPGAGVSLLAGTYGRMDVRYGSDHEPMFVLLAIADTAPAHR